ncbi:uncharacterized protein LOC142978393 isoform X1 [Anticarsia gemmatalis]|uniref:uncharacterized protein LOC142978393 isoform X1 n=1 Tax=Anticarsia gemmatalis TaxID=129554 RepID=UPI003F7772B5
MSILKKNKTPHSKSYPSVLDIFRPTSVCVLCDSHTKVQQVFHANCRDAGIKSKVYNSHSKYMKFITSDFDYLQRKVSSKTLIPSTSTIFYDLDDIAKRHSFHCMTDFGQSNTNLLKVMRMNVKNNAFAKSNATVQECATQLPRKLVPRDSIEINSRKVKKKASKDLSSEIFLRDDDYLHDYDRHYYSNNLRDICQKPQKFWSYAKYRTEYTKPEDKKLKKKEKADEKGDVKPNNNNKSKKHKRDSMEREDKPTNTSVAQLIEVMVPRNEGQEMVNQQEAALADSNNGNKTNKRGFKYRAHQKARKVLCPNCREKVNVVISLSTTEEEDSLKRENSMLNNSDEIPSTVTYNYSSSPTGHRSKTNDEDLCLHDPPCEMLPICQILPTDNYYTVNQKCMKKNSIPKSTPRVIRITKACRHHPPCTVVPSCQRANVLKNNCEYIPPCLHHPRCVNLPLCVPFSKSLHYEDSPTKLYDERDNSDCPHVPKCKYIPVCQHDSFTNLDPHQINMVSQVPNTCEVFNNYNPYLVNPNKNCVRNSCSPCQLSTIPCHTCQSNKSCQYSSLHSSPDSNLNTITQEKTSSDDIIFIRDVGCQFRSKSYSPRNSMLQSIASSNSFDLVDVRQMSNYYTNVHTLRYEDKCTNPITSIEKSFSMVSMTTIDSVCPSHGRRSPFSRKIQPTTGFQPQSAYVAAFSTGTNCNRTRYVEISKSDIEDFRDRHHTFPVRSRRNFLKCKYKNMYLVKRRRKPRLSCKLSRKSCLDV